MEITGEIIGAGYPRTYPVTIVPVMNTKVIEMELEVLKRFCKERDIPLFVLKVEKIYHYNKPQPIDKPYMKYFTIYQDWWFTAWQPVDAKASKEVME